MTDSPRDWKDQSAAAGRSALLRLLRFVLIVVIILVTLFYVLDIGQDPRALGEWEIGLVTGWPWVLLFALTLAFGVIAIDILTPEKKIATVSGVFFGIVAGVVASIAFSFLIDRLAEAYEIAGHRIISTIKILVGIGATYLCVSIVLQTQDQFRLVIPYVEFSRQIRGPRPLLLDTSALIDGRILGMVECAAVQAPINVPHFVLDELQRLADSSDKLKRARGRRGLDAVSRLQREARVEVTIDETVVPGSTVDQMLIELATMMPAMIVTSDAALGRIAGIQGLQVLNLNELAQALRPSVLPGEKLEVRLIRPGEQPSQGVGYLDDGTMVVAEDGAAHIGKTVRLTVASAIQTSAGRMIFARIGATSDGEDGPASSNESDDGFQMNDEDDARAEPDRDTDSEAEVDPAAPVVRGRDPRRAKARNPRR